MEARGLTVLVVDDEPTVRHFLRSALSLGGHDVRTAATGEEALDALGAVRVDVVLLDIKLPGISGLDVLETLAARADAPPVVMMTGYANAAVHKRLAQLPHEELLRKPFSVDDVLGAIGRAAAR